jgi:endo-1,3-1,4-beta-glycanase ExoK
MKMKKSSAFFIIVFSAFFVLTGCSTETRAIPAAPGQATELPGGRRLELNDHMVEFDSNTWNESDWTNGSAFNCGWLPDYVSFDGGTTMILTLDNTTSHNKSYSSGEYRTNEPFGYGSFEVRMKAAKANGIVSSFFLYTGNPWDEIDVEILGKDTTKAQFNYFVNGAGSHEFLQDLGFDSSADYHTYGIEWRCGSIKWYVDGVLKHTVKAERLPSHPMQIMMNLWPGIGVDDWLKPFTYKTPLKAYYDYVRYTP